MVEKNMQLQHNIRSVGRAVLVLGGFYAFLSLFIVVVALIGETYQDPAAFWAGLIYTLLLVTFWFVAGINIYRNTTNPRKALKAMAIVIFVSAVYLALSVYSSVVSGGVSSGLIIIAIFMLYMVWSYMDIKDRIHGKK